jgi:hypothetical protein
MDPNHPKSLAMINKQVCPKCMEKLSAKNIEMGNPSLNEGAEKQKAPNKELFN